MCNRERLQGYLTVSGLLVGVEEVKVQCHGENRGIAPFFIGCKRKNGDCRDTKTKYWKKGGTVYGKQGDCKIANHAKRKASRFA